MSLARRHRERMAGRNLVLSAAASSGNGTAATDAGGSNPAGGSVAAQIRMRFQADLQQLHAIKSIKAKIEAKRKMLPEYEAFCEGLLERGEYGVQTVDEILAAVMVWRIDTADYAGALKLAEHMLCYDLPMPARYNRSAATTVAEEIADAALRALGKNEAFEIDILRQVDDLTAAFDMPDQVRAKLKKAIGLELSRQAAATVDPAPATVLLAQALDALKAAQDFDQNSGVKKNIEKIERTIKANAKAIAEAATS